MGDLETALEAQRLARAGILYAPASFKTASAQELERVCNGCGAANAKFDFVPDRIWGTYIGHACHVHDWEYEHGVDEEDRMSADRAMRNNMQRIVRRECKEKWYKPVLAMEARIQGYYWAVRWRGGPAFWDGKN